MVNFIAGNLPRGRFITNRQLRRPGYHHERGG